ncbi:MAG: ligase-associated DNA damage response endonuclease PdeM [Pseudomonadota bacterium]
MVNLDEHTLTALPSGALWWEAERLLCVSDLHMGKAERIARLGGTMIPPYETQDTLTRLDQVIAATQPKTVICLGDSFDDRAAAHSMNEDERLWLARLQEGRLWIWIEGNHDPGPMDLGGTTRAEYEHNGLIFRHIATPETPRLPEISGHYHPKARVQARGRSFSRPAFMSDGHRLILPAFGTYTGGLKCTAPVLQALFQPPVIALMTGDRITPVPVFTRSGAPAQ